VTETLTYTIRRADDGVWEAVSDAWPNIKGQGRTEHLAIDHLKQQIAAAQPTMVALYETSNIGTSSNLRGVCLDEEFARQWVEENDPSKSWESRHYHRIPLLGVIVVPAGQS
jgi:hypothetical protein